MGVCFHALATRLIKVLDKAQVERTTAVLVTLELGNRSFCSFCSIETDDTCASRPTTRFILYFSLFHLANCGEQVNQIVVARGPWKLVTSQLWDSCLVFNGSLPAHISDVDCLALLSSSSSTICEWIRGHSSGG